MPERELKKVPPSHACTWHTFLEATREGFASPIFVTKYTAFQLKYSIDDSANALCICRTPFVQPLVHPKTDLAKNRASSSTDSHHSAPGSLCKS